VRNFLCLSAICTVALLVTFGVVVSVVRQSGMKKKDSTRSW
jgi:hypothetical protein